MKKIGFFFLLGLLMASCYIEDQGVGYDYANGQTMTFVPSLGHNVDSVQYYWDDIYIETKKEMPFVLIFPIQEQTSGTHYLKYWIYYTPGSYIHESGGYISSASTTKSIKIQ